MPYFQERRFAGRYLDNPNHTKATPQPAQSNPLVDALKSKVSGWWASRMKAADEAIAAQDAAKAQAERQAREDTSMAERARHAQMLRDAK